MSGATGGVKSWQCPRKNEEEQMDQPNACVLFPGKLVVEKVIQEAIQIEDRKH